eukprot:scaffold19458_cov112-Isochrysis_galbana.AAC.3
MLPSYSLRSRATAIVPCDGRASDGASPTPNPPAPPTSSPTYTTSTPELSSMLARSSRSCRSLSASGPLLGPARSTFSSRASCSR